jgi:hypothetical protein
MTCGFDPRIRLSCDRNTNGCLTLFGEPLGRIKRMSNARSAFTKTRLTTSLPRSAPGRPRQTRVEPRDCEMDPTRCKTSLFNKSGILCQLPTVCSDSDRDGYWFRKSSRISPTA